MDRKNTEAQLIDRAQKDYPFRDRLASDPSGVIHTELGIEIPAGVKITVLEETDDHVYLVLPPRTSAELDAQRLAEVVGGVTMRRSFK